MNITYGGSALARVLSPTENRRIQETSRKKCQLSRPVGLRPLSFPSKNNMCYIERIERYLPRVL